MLIKFKKIINYILFKIKGVDIDFISQLNRNVVLSQAFTSVQIRNSKIHLFALGNQCFIENTYIYGDVELEDYVSISGPGTVIHAECGKIKIGRFTSIGQNVSIQEFNHNMARPSTYAMNYHFFTHNFGDDVVSKGDIIIGEDVWIGSNVSILSGVKIGRGAVVAAGTVVCKDVPPYSVVGGVPAKLLRMRFESSTIEKLENLKWWEWTSEQIMENKDFFYTSY